MGPPMSSSNRLAIWDPNMHKSDHETKGGDLLQTKVVDWLAWINALHFQESLILQDKWAMRFGCSIDAADLGPQAASALS
jgi:hypothetical protein